MTDFPVLIAALVRHESASSSSVAWPRPCKDLEGIAELEILLEGAD